MPEYRYLATFRNHIVTVLNLVSLIAFLGAVAHAQVSDEVAACAVKGAEAKKSYIASLPPAKRPRGDPDSYGAFNSKEGKKARQIEVDVQTDCVKDVTSKYNAAHAGEAVSPPNPQTASSEKLLSCREKADAAGADALKRIYAAEGKKRPRIKVGTTREDAEARNVSDLAFEECINPNSHKIAPNNGAIANEYDSGGKHHIVINMGDQTVNTTRVIVPSGSESKVLFTTGGQNPKYFFWDEKDAGAVKEVIPGEGEGTYKSKAGTFTLILRDDKADIYPAPAKTQP